jgi:hypothetical protein
VGIQEGELMAKRLLFMVLVGSFLASTHHSFGWIYTISNDTDTPVAVDVSYTFCYAKAPSIHYLAPRSSVVIDNSKSFFMNCQINTIRFEAVATGRKLGEAQGQSYFNPTKWGDYTYILRNSGQRFWVDVEAGVKIPADCPVAALLKNYSGFGWKEWVTILGYAPGANALIGATLSALPPVAGVTLGIGLIGASVAGIGVNVWKTIFDSCFRNGKYVAWVNIKNTQNPAQAEDYIRSNKYCGANCFANPKVIVIDPDTICSYHVYQSRREVKEHFPYLSSEEIS